MGTECTLVGTGRFMIDCLSVEANSVTCILGLRPTGNLLPEPPSNTGFAPARNTKMA